MKRQVPQASPAVVYSQCRLTHRRSQPTLTRLAPSRMCSAARPQWKTMRRAMARFRPPEIQHCRRLGPRQRRRSRCRCRTRTCSRSTSTGLRVGRHTLRRMSTPPTSQALCGTCKMRSSLGIRRSSASRGSSGTPSPRRPLGSFSSRACTSACATRMTASSAPARGIASPGTSAMGISWVATNSRPCTPSPQSPRTMPTASGTASTAGGRAWSRRVPPTAPTATSGRQRRLPWTS
mmetsp:Transcript_67741/g.133230  ORF Transcript_67741/g.133230 Transcript_67741/m.133230 type:complete len:235 (-) Transcript_67741:463-1167(-)